MLDPHDDTDVPSGSTDGAPMESTSPPVLRRHAFVFVLSSNFWCVTTCVRTAPAGVAACVDLAGKVEVAALVLALLPAW